MPRHKFTLRDEDGCNLHAGYRMRELDCTSCGRACDLLSCEEDVICAGTLVRPLGRFVPNTNLIQIYLESS
jgi:hypothetical protein